MIPVETLVCNGATQLMENREVPDNFFTPATPEPTGFEKLRADFDYLVMVQGVSL